MENYNNNWFNYSCKIDKYYYKSIENREEQFYKILAIFDKDKTIKFRQLLFYLEKK